MTGGWRTVLFSDSSRLPGWGLIVQSFFAPQGRILWLAAASASMATQLDLDYDSGAECSLPDEKADDKKPDKNRGRGQSSEVGNDNKRPVGLAKCTAERRLINIRGTEEDKRVEM